MAYPIAHLTTNSAIILDDDTDCATGRYREKIADAFDDLIGETMLDFFDGMPFMMLDFSIHGERPIAGTQ